MERGRDRRYHDPDRSMGSEAYRSSERIARSPPRVNTYRGNRSPPRRGRTPPQYMESQAPTDMRGQEHQQSRSIRRRSRSPAFRGGRDMGGGYRGRPRSPPRTFSPRRDVRVRSPPPLTRRYSRSPPMNGGTRTRSPYAVKRVREPSPLEDRHPRSPPYTKRVERYASPPRETFARRVYSPARDNAPRFSRENNYRPPIRERSRSPIRRPEHISHRGSPISSRRSSPQAYSERVAMIGSGNHSPSIRNSRVQPNQQSPTYHGRSPPRRGYTPPIQMSPPRDTIAYRQRSPPPARRRESPPPRERNDFRNDNSLASNTWSTSQMPSIPQGSTYHNGDSRGPPSGPSSVNYNGSYSRESPSGPPSAPISMSAHNRPSSASLLSAPTRPRGGPHSFGREHSRDGPYGGPPPRRGGYPQQSSHHGPPPRYQNYERDVGPHGHRGGPPPHHSNGPPPFEARTSFEPRPPFRTNNSSSTTYPRTQRFATHLSGVPAIVPGGKLAPSGHDPEREKRIAQLEADSKRLMEAIEEKQKAKREGLREWERTERERTREGLKSELAEGALERMQGEGSTSGAAF